MKAPRLPGPCRDSLVGIRLCSILEMCRSPLVCHRFPMGSWEVRVGAAVTHRNVPLYPVSAVSAQTALEQHPTESPSKL